MKRLLFVVFVAFLASCGEPGGDGTSVANVPDLVAVPKHISITPPTQNTDGSLLDNLSKYRLYYGPDEGALKAALDIDSESITITSYTFSTAELELLESLFSSNITHVFSITAINKLNVESSFSNIANTL